MANANSSSGSGSGSGSGGGELSSSGGGGGGGMLQTTPEIDASEIVIEHMISDGAFGTVYKGRCRQKDVAVKILCKQFDESTLQAFRKEVEIMSKVYHPNVSLFMGACTSVPGQLMMCNELLKQDLESLLLDENVNLPLLLRMHMARDAALGMLWLHSSKPVFIHRDLKTSNLLIDEHFNVKVCDFGLSQIKPSGQNLLDGSDGAKGTPLWMAPEILSGQEFNEKADVYSFGLVLWQILTRQDIFVEYDNLELFARDLCVHEVRPVIPETANPKLADLIAQCWHQDPTVRPDFSHIVATLDEIILEMSILDPSGREFWQYYFKFKETISWQEFIDAFSQAHNILDTGCSLYEQLEYQPHKLGESEIMFRCLKALLLVQSERVIHSGVTDEDVVTMEQFGNVLAWFGRFSEGLTLLEKVLNVLRHEWFHGDIATGVAESRLMHKPEGTFLVRFSTSEPGAYTISKVSKFGAISHQRVFHKPCTDEYCLSGVTYASLPELVAKEAQQLNLLVSCPGTRFLVLFAKINIQGYI
eukprot:TRINITY_DN14_c0_g1_i1.p1 TRINITY_DN14_c0_g1~~TRINITY_DN14_c0_g1_i1.p1  ORF type:complete len:540 (-),score=156.53 TRINITY_DN14_c0_g1_i1:58-1647(-)